MHLYCTLVACGDGCNAFPQKNDSVINVKVEFGEGEGKEPLDNIAERAEAYKPKERVTYKMIKEYIEAKYIQTSVDKYKFANIIFYLKRS